jgi:hypothetical protein
MPKGSPQDKVIERIKRKEGVSLGTAVARAKHRKLVKQKGKHLKATERGKRVARRRSGRKR